MKKRRLRGYVIPTICFMLICTIIFSSYKMFEIITENTTNIEEYKYVSNSEPENVKPTINQKISIIRPYVEESVVASIPYYNNTGTDEQQQSSLIYYEGIYMQNTGVLYTAPESFDVVAVLDGIVKDIKVDSIMGNIVEIEHNNNLTTIYQNLGEVQVTIGASISQGTIIGTSGANKLTSDNPNALHFEVFYKGELVNPEEFYLLDPSELG